MHAGGQPEIGYFAAGMDKMRLLKERATLTRLQYLVWAAILLISFFGMLSSDGARRSAASAIINTCFYALIIYGNIRLLYPRFYERKRYALYIAGSVLLLLLAGALQVFLSFVHPSRYILPAPHLLGPSTYAYFFFLENLVF